MNGVFLCLFIFISEDQDQDDFPIFSIYRDLLVVSCVTL